MGSSQSTQVKQTTEILNKSVTNIVNTNKMSANAKSTNVNTFRFEIGEKGDVECDTFDLSQRIKADQTVKVASKVANAAEMKTLLKSSVDNASKQSNEAVNGFLSTAFNNQKSNTEITNILKNEIENNITNENVTECNAIIDNANNGVILIRGKMKCKDFKAPQEIISQQYLECFAEAASDAIMNNEAIAAAVNKAESSNTSKNAGAAELVSSFMGPYAMIIIAVIISIVVILGLIMYFVLGSSSTTTETTVSQYLRSMKKGGKRRYY
jgi:hypothetical protein